jgi:Phosphoadenosine phosphosulfate reductase family
MKKVRHVLGISGGKDSAALAIYMKDKYPDLNIEYYTSDTGKELDETYRLINNLEIYLGKKINRLKAFEDSPETPFDHKLKTLGGFLPSQRFRWCTKSLKLDVFERFVGTDPVISYVGIRGDESREGYISKKPTIQSIFPFRKNIWSEDVMAKVLSNGSITQLLELYEPIAIGKHASRMREILSTPTSLTYSRDQKLKQLLEVNTKDLNQIVFGFLQSTDYPLSAAEVFPLLDNEDNLELEDIFNLLNSSGVGVPAYYNEIAFEFEGKKASYARSRSGCFFCFYQQKIEWVWLYEQHPEKFKEAMEYEKSGYTWNEDEPLEDLIKPERIVKIKEEYIKRMDRTKNNQSPYLVDILNDAEGEGCAACFI